MILTNQCVLRLWAYLCIFGIEILLDTAILRTAIFVTVFEILRGVGGHKFLIPYLGNYCRSTWGSFVCSHNHNLTPSTASKNVQKRLEKLHNFSLNFIITLTSSVLFLKQKDVNVNVLVVEFFYVYMRQYFFPY